MLSGEYTKDVGLIEDKLNGLSDLSKRFELLFTTISQNQNTTIEKQGDIITKIEVLKTEFQIKIGLIGIICGIVSAIITSIITSVIIKGIGG